MHPSFFPEGLVGDPHELERAVAGDRLREDECATGAHLGAEEREEAQLFVPGNGREERNEGPRAYVHSDTCRQTDKQT